MTHITSRENHGHHRGFVPPYVLRRAAEAEGGGQDLVDSSSGCARTLEIDNRIRHQRAELRHDRLSGLAAAAVDAPAKGGFTVHSADHTARLPGDPVRDQDQPESGDAAVDEAWAGVAGALALFEEVYGRSSYDGKGAHVTATVHYERDYNNAFWDGRQLVFGDGDGKLFVRFTKPIEVGAHEFSHAVVEHTAGLVYQGQPGALNESMADVFGSCVKQRVAKQSAEEGDWLIGEGIFAKGVNGKALRSMSRPGTAYDDPALGKDPQPAHMDDYISTTEDNGGVHLNSGIPNRAFYLAATSIGGSAADGAGKIWYDALLAVSSDADFATFAAATVEAAGDHADAVKKAWSDVGVTPGHALPTDDPSDGPGQLPTDPPAPRRVEVTRSGGFAGLTTSGSLDLDDDDPETQEVRSLLGRTNLRGVKAGRMHPDAFVYTIKVDDEEPVTLVQTDLDDDLRRVAEVVLRRT